MVGVYHVLQNVWTIWGIVLFGSVRILMSLLHFGLCSASLNVFNVSQKTFSWQMCSHVGELSQVF